jgi:hypothetical protein
VPPTASSVYRTTRFKGVRKKLVMCSPDVEATRCEALFVSALQRSECPTLGEVQQAITLAVREFGSGGCAGRVAQEFGDHPDTAVARMRWARTVLADLDGGPPDQLAECA